MLLILKPNSDVFPSGSVAVAVTDDPAGIGNPLVTLKLPVPGLDKPQLVVLCHYAMRVWDRSHYGSWHLYGHSHGNLPPWKSDSPRLD